MAGAVKVALPEVKPVSAKIPLLVPARPTVRVGAEKVSCVLVAGVVPAPPPRTNPPEANKAEDAQVLADEKYGIPPEVPATVNAGVVVGVPTEINPPVNPTLVTPPAPVPQAAPAVVIVFEFTNFAQSFAAGVPVTRTPPPPVPVPPPPVWPNAKLPLSRRTAANLSIHFFISNLTIPGEQLCTYHQTSPRPTVQTGRTDSLPFPWSSRNPQAVRQYRRTRVSRSGGMSQSC